MTDQPDPPGITDDERRAIKSLQRLAKRWPQSLQLFSWSGSLCVIKGYKGGRGIEDHIVENISGIPNDGGDPGP